jgi:hypothetical protein
VSFGLLARLGATLATTATLALLLGSCGGKAGETYTGSGGSPGSGGSKSSGGTSSSAGSGGLPDCSTVRCVAPTCPGGQVAVKPPGECCASCPGDPNCANVVCDDVRCEAGYHAETPAGECCLACVPDVSCEAGKMGWQALYDTLTTELDALSCTVNEDCTVVSLGSLCRLDCGTAVNVSSAETLGAELNGYGAENCASCPQSGAMCPAVILTAVCTDGVCEIL